MPVKSISTIFENLPQVSFADAALYALKEPAGMYNVAFERMVLENVVGLIFAGVLLLEYISVMLLQDVKAASIVLTLSGIYNLVSAVHPLNVLSSIVCRLEGRFTLSNAVHPSNADAPMVVTLLGKSMLVSAVHPLKALSSIVSRL